ncbi:phytochrome-like protein cph2 [Andreesenia angusta]|uniref:Phytochrome-like protein cph2 n=1 Tax=Andreesenia angusta TaxID=39480 RepID=A0A1S1V9M6_9FIRM|nr:EAL domain-containing protein [Andreesenia angusta]OHW63288.1 phytochrome-like protein cph2 [Andreesenia angusta]
MTSTSTALSMAFFATFAIYMFFGIYILSLNPREKLNRIFFGVCMTLCIWSFAFSIANSAPVHSEALLWRKISAIGWGTMYSFLLHFIFVLTEKKETLGKKRTYFAIYTPAIINVYAFSLYGKIATERYKLISTSFGWVNTSLDSGWDWYFNFYYMGFMILGIFTVWSWGRNAWDESKAGQSKLLAMSFMVALVLGTITEQIFNKRIPVYTPQIAPLIILIPISTIAYSIKRHGLMRPVLDQKPIGEERILSESIRKRIYYSMGAIYVCGGFLSFSTRYFVHGYPLYDELKFSAVCLLMGASVVGIKKLNLKADVQDMVFIAFISISLFRITSRYADNSATVWAVPFMCIILSVLFNKRGTIVLLGFSTLLIQVWTFLSVSESYVRIGFYDYVARLAITAGALAIAFFVNRVYVERLKENKEQIEFQKMLSEISTDFIAISEDSFDEKVMDMLRLSGEHYGVDRVYLFMCPGDKEKMLYTHEWCGEDVELVRKWNQEIELKESDWWTAQLKDMDVVDIADIDELPDEARDKKKQLKSLGVKSTIAISIKDKENVIGILGFDSVKKRKKWRKEHQDALKILANMLSDAIVKVGTEREMNYMAYYDSLTGLPNFTLYRKKLKRAIETAREKETLLCMALIDLDSFKSVNDMMGHESGDEILKRVSRRLLECVGEHGMVARFGGDEFLLMLDSVSSCREMESVLECVMDSFVEPISIGSQEFHITASVGVARYPDDGHSADELIKNSDMAMYSSKDNGKNRFTFCSLEMKHETLEKVKLTNSLYRALERDELALHYQPQIDIRSGKLVGLEALIRWTHPEHGIVSPGVFIPLAEQTGLINAIGEWVIATACRQGAYWHKRGLEGVRMAVNLSVEQFKSSSFSDRIESILLDTGMSPELLELEVTESIALDDSYDVVNTLEKLRESNIMVAIDDFGTEYSSLSRIKLLPADRIKIDRQFVESLAVDKRDRAVVRAIIELARNLDFKVIAEGVETEEQVEFLKSQNCDEIQGYYYCRPLPPEELEKSEIFNH